MNCILEKFPGNFPTPWDIGSLMNGLPDREGEGYMTPLKHDPPNAAPDEGAAVSPHSPPIAATDEGPPVARLTAAEARERVAAGRGVLVDTRDARLFDNAHAAGALSLPLSTIEAAHGQVPAGSLPPDRVLIFYCA